MSIKELAQHILEKEGSVRFTLKGHTYLYYFKKAYQKLLF